MKKHLFYVFIVLFFFSGCFVHGPGEANCKAYIDFQKRIIYLTDSTFYINMYCLTYNDIEDSCHCFLQEDYGKSYIQLDSVYNRDCNTNWNDLKNKSSYINIFLDIRDRGRKYCIQCSLDSRIDALKNGAVEIEIIYE